ncbi:hypothetical protein Hanom_Chr16g01488851 [Helianthus anomalus]
MFRTIKQTMEEIKENTFLWLKGKSKFGNLVSERWLEFNVRDVITYYSVAVLQS